ncbi:L-fucose:H+ symporter permease [Prolixibacteraceae bacterium JC049]|nr:L-fucose:H+ symporter permease [Prolixibacteraceae bacterium JC049]
MVKDKVIPKGILIPFILITSLFFLWGLANNMTDTLLAAFKRIMSMSDSRTALIQISCYGLGYFIFAIPAAIYIKKYSYKSGILLGLGLYLLGCFLFFPAKITGNYFHFLGALWILFGGLSVLETAANPYIIAMGPEETGTRRLNLAQSFNPIGSIMGVFLSQVFILSSLNKAGADERAAMSPEQLQAIQSTELNSVTMTYVSIGALLLVLWLVIYFAKMPRTADAGGKVDFIPTVKRLLKNKNYTTGVVAQLFYVGAQIGIWSFTIRYAMQELQLEKMALPEGKTAEQIAANYYLASLILFVSARFVCTALMKYVKPGKLLTIMSFMAIGFTMMVVFVGGQIGVYSLVAISGCMSLMFPTIFGLAVKGLGEDTKIAGSGLIMTIVGGAIVTQLQGLVSTSVDSFRATSSLSIPAGINVAYLVPACCFLFIAWYAIKIASKH